MIFLNLVLSSCQKTKFKWQPGLSAPKYYPIADVAINFENAGNGTQMPFDSGWGTEYGGVVSGDEYKDIPKEVTIRYNSSAENYVYKGKIKLPQEKIFSLFKKYDIGENKWAHLVVGMAPGGWIRVWFKTIDKQVEVVKSQLKGQYDDTTNEKYKVKNFENWGKYYTYWQYHGIPYDAWANNEKEYDLYFDFNQPNKRKIGLSYVSKDGTFYQGVAEKCYQKLPTEIELCWLDESDNDYCCKIPLPKTFNNWIELKKLKQIHLKLEIERDQQHAILYLVSNGKTEKILRVKNVRPTNKEVTDNNYSYAQDIEYFIK
ncbi:uncharacterized protein CHSO_0339 [Chryseobacterium sp. StRB126]|nr:uncharacterized protein CHSO_0339 [Chryseobacterium sp. StRB126]